MYKLINIVPFDEISTKDLKIFNNLIEIGKDRNDVRYGLRVISALFVKGVLCEKNNTTRNYYSRKYYLSLHAERNAILQYAKTIIKSNGWFNTNGKIKGKSVIYVLRLHELQGLGCSKPCKECEGIIYKHGIKFIKYTDYIDGKKVICTMKIKN